MRARPPNVTLFQNVDSAKTLFRPVGQACAWNFPGSLQVRKRIWLHYRAIRVAVEITATFGTAALVGYWIVQSLAIVRSAA